MTKLTQKYIAALKLPVFDAVVDDGTYASLYHQLNSLGWYWSVLGKEWYFDKIDSFPPTKEIRIRVWASATRVNSAAKDVEHLMEQSGYKCVEKPRERPCLPPHQNESRVYLVFKKAGG